MTKRIYGVIDKWKEQCDRYQSMKEQSIKLLEHPDATEEQLLEVARVLRDTRKRMTDMRDLLNATYKPYVFDLKGAGVKRFSHYTTRAQSTPTTV